MRACVARACVRHISRIGLIKTPTFSLIRFQTTGRHKRPAAYISLWIVCTRIVIWIALFRSQVGTTWQNAGKFYTSTNVKIEELFFIFLTRFNSIFIKHYIKNFFLFLNFQHIWEIYISSKYLKSLFKKRWRNYEIKKSEFEY